MDAEGSASPAASASPRAASPLPIPTIEELLNRIKPCKVVLEDCRKNGAIDNDGDSTDGGEDDDDGYEDSSETALLPNRGTSLTPSVPPTTANDSGDMLKPPTAGLSVGSPKIGLLEGWKSKTQNSPDNHKDHHTSIYSTSFKQFTLKCCFEPCDETAHSIRDITDHFKVAHNLSAAAMVWDKPMEPGQTEPEWQKRFEVIITHGEVESIELAKGGFRRTGEPSKKGRAQFQCSRCDVVQQQSKSMIRHIEEHHCGFRRYTCALCGKQTHAVHMQIEHWDTAHSSHLSSKDSLVVYSRHLTLTEMSQKDFDEMKKNRPPLNNVPFDPTIIPPSIPQRQNGVHIDVKPSLNQLAASASTASTTSASSTSASSTDEATPLASTVIDAAEPEAPPPKKRARTVSQKQTTPVPLVAAAAALTAMPVTASPQPTTVVISTPEMATEPGEYELLMPVKVRVSDDKIRYITFGVPRSGEKVKDQIIQLRQLDSSMVLNKNCFAMPNTAPLVATAAVPTSQAVIAANHHVPNNASLVSVPNYIAAANHVIVQPPINENGIGRQVSPLPSATPNMRLPIPRQSRQILTIPQPPPFPVNAAPTHILPLTSVAATTNGIPSNAALIPNQIAIPGLVNGVAMISPQQIQHQQPQQLQAQSQPTRLPVASSQNVAIVTKPPQQQPQTQNQQQQQQPPAAQRVEVGDAVGSSMSAVATVLTRYKCNQCDAVYNNRDSIVAHIYTHMKVRPFKCALCNSIAAMSKTILKHLNKEHSTNDSSLILEQRIPNESSYYSAVQ